MKVGILMLRSSAVAEPPEEEGRTETDLWPNGSVTASSASQADVQTAVTAAVDGQRVLIPDGTATWTSGITTTKQILIRAENYTPTDEGTATRSVTITNNAPDGTPLFAMTTGDTYHVGVAGIRFNDAASDRGNNIRFVGSGSKVPLVSDVYMQTLSRTSDSGANGVALITVLTQGGVIWNTKVVGAGTNPNGNGPESGGVGLYIQSPRAWESNSTLGDDDTNGTVNVYFEDSSLFNVSNWPDCEDQGRYVSRYCDIDGTHGTGHGFTGEWGSRHMEYYNNNFHVSDDDRAIARRYVWIRAGTGVMHHNVTNNADDPSQWGDIHAMEFGEEFETPGTYLYDRQPGCGWENGDYISDPIYMYDETGDIAYSWGNQNDWEAHVVANRDVFPADGGPNPGAKPGYAPYTYPHPLRYTP